MSSSAHSALASLTANYTDSEPEEDDIDKSEEVLEKDDSENKITGGSISPPDESNSRDTQSVSSAGDSISGGSRSKSNNPLGLVSYHDDLIDDDVVDDFDHNSDSLQDNEASGPDEASAVQSTSDFGAGGDEVSSNKHDIDLEDVSQDKDVSYENDALQQPSKRIRLPAEPSLKCSQELQDKFTRLYDRKMKQRFNMNSIIQSNKQFRNPSIYEKLIIRCNIDELGTNYPKNIYDPHIWDDSPSSYYDELAKAQKTEMERREKERKERTKVEFVSGTVKKTAPSSSGVSGTQSEGEPKRKSKWDQKGVMPVFGAAVPAPTVQPVLVQPPFTANASGTKGTVINAFGSLPKKPKI